LTKSIGADESQWTWGKIAIARFPHPLAAAPLIGCNSQLRRSPRTVRGSVNVGSSVFDAAHRRPERWDKTQNGIPLGESGTANSAHWKDQLDDWRNVTPARCHLARLRSMPRPKNALASAERELIHRLRRSGKRIRHEKAQKKIFVRIIAQGQICS